jgi:hypothetical protein
LKNRLTVLEWIEKVFVLRHLSAYLPLNAHNGWFIVAVKNVIK